MPFAAHSIYTTRASILEENRETAVGVVAALWDALDDSDRTRPDEAKEPVKSDSFPDLDQAVYDQSFDALLPGFLSRGCWSPEQSPASTSSWRS